MRKRRSMVAVVPAFLAALVAGCAALDYQVDRDRAVYLAGKDATYLAWRLEAVSVEELERARPAVEAVRRALAAEDEEALDAALAESLHGLVEIHAAECDREIVNELIDAALEDVRTREPGLFESEPKRVALLVVGGVLDGIAYVKKTVEDAGR